MVFAVDVNFGKHENCVSTGFCLFVGAETTMCQCVCMRICLRVQRHCTFFFHPYECNQLLFCHQNLTSFYLYYCDLVAFFCCLAHCILCLSQALCMFVFFFFCCYLYCFCCFDGCSVVVLNM